MDVAVLDFRKTFRPDAILIQKVYGYSLHSLLIQKVLCAILDFLRNNCFHGIVKFANLSVAAKYRYRRNQKYFV